MTVRQTSRAQRGFVGFLLGEVSYAVPIANVREIVNPLTLTELPHVARAIAGVADHRGEVIPIVDLRIRFGLPKEQDQRRTKWVLVKVEERTIGLRVDSVTEVFGQGGLELRPAPELGAGDDVRGLAGVLTHDGRMHFVLDLERLDALARSIDAPGVSSPGALGAGASMGGQLTSGQSALPARIT
jgi:purine-binding chemotaxis protein CheW